MDAGFAQVVSSALGALGSVTVAVIAGYFTVRAAQVQMRERETSEQVKVGKKETSEQGMVGDKETPEPMQFIKAANSWSIWVVYALVCGVVSIPLAFAFAYTGNSLSGDSSNILFGDSLDPALVSGILGFVGFMLGAWTGNMKLGTGKMLRLFFIVGIFSAPVAYSLAYTGNWLSGEPAEMLFLDSLDSLIVGGIMCAVCFIIGMLMGSRLRKEATA